MTGAAGSTRLLVKNGTVVTAAETVRADVLIEGERVVAVGMPLDGPADWVIDAAERYVMPGGVDVHTHMELPVGRFVTADDFFTGTRAAAFGGTTTVIDFFQSEPGESLQAGFERWRAKGAKSCLDYGLHGVIREASDPILAEMDRLVAEGVTSFKVFMAYPGRYMLDDASILRVMGRAASQGAMVMLHAEQGEAVESNVRRFLAEGLTGPRHHAATRPPAVEAEAVRRAYQLAERARTPAYVVHLSSAEGLEEVRRARGRVRALTETCPQYLFLTDEKMAGTEGANFVCSPPLRARGHGEALWSGLDDGSVQVVATDHAPFTLSDKAFGENDFTKIPNGLPTVEDRFTLLFQGVLEGRIGLNRFVDLVATAPARLFGLYPKKGTIEPGSDADLVVFDPGARRTLSAQTHHMNVDYSCFEGLVVRGLPEVVIQRGRVLVARGEFHGSPGDGRYLPRNLPEVANTA